MIETNTAGHQRDENGVGDNKEGYWGGKGLIPGSRGAGRTERRPIKMQEEKKEHVILEKWKSAWNRFIRALC